MTCLTILRNTLKLNAAVIVQNEANVAHLRSEAKAWKAQGETAFFVAACDDMKKAKKKLAKQVALQKRVKVEIATFFRNARIVSKFEQLFGHAPAKATKTSHEQEAMLDKLLAEKDAAANDSNIPVRTEVVKTA